MGDKFIKKNKEDIEAQLTNHGVGQKKIFAEKAACQSNLTQAAWGMLKRGETVKPHIHHTMEEFYYFDSGELIFYIVDKKLICKKGDFLMVPAGVEHFLEVQADCAFVYWGISI